jgi:hypothetical protein
MYVCMCHTPSPQWLSNSFSWNLIFHKMHSLCSFNFLLWAVTAWLWGWRLLRSVTVISASECGVTKLCGNMILKGSTRTPVLHLCRDHGVNLGKSSILEMNIVHSKKMLFATQQTTLAHHLFYGLLDILQCKYNKVHLCQLEAASSQYYQTVMSLMMLW